MAPWLWLAACAANGAPALATATHCRSDERVQFSCRVGAKTASLCVAGPAGRIDSLSYRYGLPGQVEHEFSARSDNGLRFQGTVMPASPGALVRQVWFDRGKTRYLLTQCVGGQCIRPSGLSVLSGEQVQMNERCAPPSSTDLDSFDRELVHFGASLEASHSNTPLLELGEYDNLLDKLYGGEGRR